MQKVFCSPVTLELNLNLYLISKMAISLIYSDVISLFQMKGLATYLCEKIGFIEDTELKIQNVKLALNRGCQCRETSIVSVANCRCHYKLGQGERKKIFKGSREIHNIKILTKNMRSERVVKNVSIPYFFQKRLNKAYKILFSNNIEI